MPRRRYRNRNHYRSQYRSAGTERALQHIREAEELSRELGGMDKDVKQYFFDLPHSELELVFKKYGQEHGLDREEYARETFRKWKNGTVKMSGMVATRLLKLLPPRMPLEKKYELIKNLWEFKGPSSEKHFYFGVDADPGELISLVRQHLEEVVRPHNIPENISARFEWLARNDSDLYQKLQNYYRQLEKGLIQNFSFDRINTLVRTLQSNPEVHQGMKQELKVGKHSVTIHYMSDVQGVTEHAPIRNSRGNDGGWGCLLVIGFLVFFFWAISK